MAIALAGVAVVEIEGLVSAEQAKQAFDMAILQEVAVGEAAAVVVEVDIHIEAAVAAVEVVGIVRKR